MLREEQVQKPRTRKAGDMCGHVDCGKAVWPKPGLPKLGCFVSSLREIGLSGDSRPDPQGRIMSKKRA